MAFEESTSTPQVSGKTDHRTVNLFLIIGIIGFLGTIVIEMIYTGIYLEYVRVYNIDPSNWLAVEPIIDMLITVQPVFFYTAMLSSVGLYGVIDRNRGRFGLFLVFITLWPYSFSIWDLLYFLPIDYNLAYLLSTAFSVSLALIAGIILTTTRDSISKPKLLYLIIILMIAAPIVYYVKNVFGLAGIAASQTEYLILSSPGMAVFYTRIIATIALLVIEHRRGS
jgi:hypothetical protein